ncbi:MAG: amidohydrolase family protein [Chloroflexi bacterium]|nr:amidohydrolase family protein [Chloroflexota bacterium]
MRQGFRVIDADTHVNPSLQLLLRYAEGDKAKMEGRLKPHTLMTKRRSLADSATEEHDMLSINPVRYNRVAGQKGGGDSLPRTGAQHNLMGRTKFTTSKEFSVATAEDNPAGRLVDMDVEGRDIDFIIPGTWAYAATSLELDLTLQLFTSYHNYMSDFCSEDSRRLKGLIIAPCTDPQWAAAAIRRYAKEDWAAAVWPVLPEGMPIDDPDLEPIWQAASEGDFPILYHSFHVMSPYFPGYRDVWDNAVMGRTAGQTWGAARFIAFMTMSGVLDRYPNLRLAPVEAGHGWLPHWLIRLGRQIEYVSGAVPPDLKHTPLEYAQMGRIFCGIDYNEGPEMTKAVNDVIGPDILMYQSDYPHPETSYPDTTDLVLGWKELLGAEATGKLMWENAARCFRLTTTPW